MTPPPEAASPVLVVDDDEAVRTGVLWLLRAAGYEAEGYASGAALLAGADPAGAHCAVLDIHLDDADGFALGTSLRRSAPQLQLIFITGDADPSLDGRARGAGALALMRKPVDPECLLALIDSIPQRGAPR
ncbi:response regulator [uncultured Massilia sp.]|uniref:response regulator n=1 Tax=uncultured Massilia sp. TaxID=169973 RepID=UPI0025F6587E|nr:response regulator [uncultured Massilia sp.]